MNDIDLGQLDLNLLLVLDVLLEERHVTRASKRLGRTQSAVSHALGRLRDQLGDPLLVRMGGRMEPTPRAQALAPEVRRVLDTLRRVLAKGSGWDPATDDRTFRIVAPDFVAAALPELLADLSVSAPEVGVELITPGAGTFRDVAAGRHDLVVAPPRSDTDGLDSRHVATLPWVVFARRGHPAVKGWSEDAWLAYPHLRVRTSGRGSGPVDRALEARGRTRRGGPVLPHFLLAPPLLLSTDVLFTAPHGVLADVAERFDLVALPCPITLAPIEVSMFWSAQLAADPANVWFRGRIEAALGATFGADAQHPSRPR